MIWLSCLLWWGVQDRELEHWEESPEEFHHQSDSAAFRDNVRPCAELLFATLLQVSLLLLLLPPIPTCLSWPPSLCCCCCCYFLFIPHVVSDH